MAKNQNFKEGQILGLFASAFRYMHFLLLTFINWTGDLRCLETQKQGCPQETQSKKRR